jgi:hypothetical protein
MLQAQTLRSDHIPHVFDLGIGAVGYLTTSDRFSAVPLARCTPEGNLLFLSGVPIDPRGNLADTLATVAKADYRTAARLLPTLDGAYAAVFWDQRHQKLVVVTDFLGLQPLYTAEIPGSLLLASELRGIAASGRIALDLDPAGWGTFVSFGYFLGSATALNRVRLVEPAAVVTFDAVTGSIDTSTYWRWPEPRRGLTIEQVETGPLADFLCRHVEAYAAHAPEGTILLSGGVDSRLILCAMLRTGLRPKALILSYPVEHDDADGRFAAQLARSLGVAHSVATAVPDFYSSDAYVDYLIASEVTTPSLGLFITQVFSQLSPTMEAVWEGVASGAPLKISHQPPGGFAEFLAQECHPFESARWSAAARVFAPALLGAMRHGCEDQLASERARYADDEFGVSEFIARNRKRNRYGLNPFKVYANTVLPLTPGISKDYFALGGGIPYAVRADHRLVRELFRRHFPEGAGLPFITGSRLVKARASLDLPYYATLARTRVMRLPYLGGALRRLGLRPRMVRGESQVLARTLARVEPDHPDLTRDAVRALTRQAAASDPVARAARELLFYWQMWRWVMDGSVHARRRVLVASIDSPAAM